MRVKLFFIVLLVFIAGSIMTLAQPVLQTPADGATGVSVTPTLDWTNTGTHYDMEIDDNADFSSLVWSAVNNPANSYLIPFSLAYSTTYYWRIKETLPVPSAWSAAFQFTTGALPAPSKPTLNSPIADEVVDQFPTLVWNASAPITIDLTYSLQVTPDPTFYFVPAASNLVGIAATSYSILTALDKGSPYYWRVKATNGAGSSSWSDVRKFVVSLSGVVTPPVPVLTFPSDASTIQGLSIDLRWYANYFGNDLTYVIEHGTSPVLAGATTVNILVPGTTSYLLGGLAFSTTYYWRVKSIKEVGNESAFSAINSFTTPPPVAATVPIPSWPIGSAEIYNTTPTLYWYLNSNSVGLTFDLQYNLIDNTFDGDEVLVSPLAVTNHALPVLTAGQVVYWRVRSDNGVDPPSAWSATESFSIANTAVVPVVPIISWPKGGTVVYASDTDLMWYVNGNSTGLYYEVQFQTTTPILNGDPIFGTTLPNVFLLDNVPLSWATNYYWRVRSADGINPPSAWTAEESFSTFGTAGANTPIQSWPLNGTTVYGTNQQLSWYVNGPTLGYTYEVTVNGGVVAPANLTTSYVYTPLTPGATYTWSVRSELNGNYSAPSPTYTFYAYSGFAPMAPLLGSPVNGISISTSSPELSWFINSPTTSLKYELNISDNSNFLNSMVFDDFSDLAYIADNLAPNSTYYWRVRSKDTGGNYSAYSKTENFSVDNTTGVEDENILPSEFAVEQNYPNPFNPSTTIKYSIPVNSFVNIKIYDMLGREIKTLIRSEQKAGSYEVRWNGDNNSNNKVASGT
ncbi:MAG: hypothetical protein K8H86_07180, partial [Ignavibacteriaceae bacterium]|nr:hypothetical protein [Ignavibacteriaceae bacterium]